MEELEKLLISKEIRENAGSRTSNRFEYQKNWAICKIIEIYDKNEDFILLLEYHDDITLILKNGDISKIEFYQIKTKEGNNWTVGDLVKEKSDSILSKMYENIKKFDKRVNHSALVSNACYNLKLRDRDAINQEFYLEDIEDKTKEKIIKNLKEVLKISDIDCKKLKFEVSNMAIHDSETFVRGKLSKFLENEEIKNYNIGAIYRIIQSEINKKNNYELKIKNDLFEKKGIDKKYVIEMLDNIKKYSEIKIDWDKICSKFEFIKKLKLLETANLKKAFEEIKSQIQDIENTLIRENLKKIGEKMDEKMGENETSEELYNDLINIKLDGGYNQWQIKAMILYKMHEKL